MPQTIKIIDDIANQVVETTIPGSIVMFVGTSVKQAIGQDVVTGTPTELRSVFGKYPADPASLVNGNLTEVQKEKVIDQLNRNIPYNADMLNSMFTKGSEPVLVAVRVGEYGFAKNVFNENQLINGAADPYNKPTKPGVPLPSITFEALEGGDEYNYFGVKIETNALGIASKLTVKYEMPITSGYGSLTAIEDARIQTPYELDIEGLTIDEIVTMFNSPLNPFSSYIQSSANYVEIVKDTINYTKGMKNITIGNNEEGAFRLKNIKQFTLNSSLMPSVFTQGIQSFSFGMSVKKDPKGIIKTMKEPELTVTIPYATAGEFKSQSFKTLVPPTGAMANDVVRVYKYKFIPEYNMFWDKDLTTMKVDKVYMDGEESKKPSDFQFRAEPGTNNFEITVSEAVIDGIPAPEVNVVDDQGDPIKHSVSMNLATPTAGELAFTAEKYPGGFAVVYQNKNLEYSISEREKFPAGITGKVLKVKFNTETIGADELYKVSESLKHILIIGYAQVGSIEIPVVLASTQVGFDVTTTEKSTWKLTHGDLTIQDDSADGNTFDPAKNNSAIAKESLTIIYKFVPRMFEVQDTAKLNGTWNTYWANGNRVIFGDIIPENFTLDAKFEFSYALREGTDYVVLSSGKNPGDETDTISILLKPESTDQFSSIPNGVFTLKYEVVPALPGRTNSFVFLKGGIEENYLSDEQYLDLCIDKIRYYAPKYKPTHIYICGMATDFKKDGFDPVTGEARKLPINSLPKIGELVDKLNETFPCSVVMESMRNYIVNTIDKNIASKVKEFLVSHTQPSNDDFNAVVLRSSYNSPNIRLAAGLLSKENTTAVNGRQIPYKTPIMASIISLRNSLIQDFNYERTSNQYLSLPTGIISLIEGEELYTELQFYGFEMYSRVHTSRGRTLVRAITNPTCVLQDNAIAQGRVYQEVDDAIKKCVQVALGYNEEWILGTIGMSAENIKAHTDQIQLRVTDTFKTNKMLKSITVGLTYANKYNMIRGIGDMTIDAVFYPSMRTVNATAKLTIQQ